MNFLFDMALESATSIISYMNDVRLRWISLQAFQFALSKDSSVIGIQGVDKLFIMRTVGDCFRELESY